MSCACSRVTPLCARSRGVLLRERLAQRRRRPGRPASIPERSTPAEIAVAWISVAPAEQRHVDDARVDQLLGGTQDALVRALRQDDATPVEAGSLEQVEREHERRDGLRMRQPDVRRQLLDIDAGVELTEGGRDLAAARGPDLAAQRLQRVERRVGVGLDRDDRHARMRTAATRSSGRVGGRRSAGRPAGVGMSRLSADAAVPTARSARSPEATTRAPSDRIGSRVCRCPEPATYASTSRCRLSGLPTRTTPPSPSTTSSTVRADRTGRSRRT